MVTGNHMTDFCEHGKELSDPIKCGKYLG